MLEPQEVLHKIAIGSSDSCQKIQIDIIKILNSYEVFRFYLTKDN